MLALFTVGIIIAASLPADAYSVKVFPTGSTRGSVVFTGSPPIAYFGYADPSTDNVQFHEFTVGAAPSSNANWSYNQTVVVYGDIYYYDSANTVWRSSQQLSASGQVSDGNGRILFLQADAVHEPVGYFYTATVQVIWKNAAGTIITQAVFFLDESSTDMYTNGQDYYGGKDTACVLFAYNQGNCTPVGDRSSLNLDSPSGNTYVVYAGYPVPK